jgi:predicted porin
MESGFVTGSRWGIKGTEDLGSFKVGFTLESGFTHDDGKSAQGSRLFGREAVVTVEGDFGKVYMGRIGSIVSDSGSLSLLGNASVFGNCYGFASMKYSTAAAMTRYDNVIGYVAPKFAGVEVRAMYSMDADSGVADDAGENKAGSDRYAAFGVTYAAGPLTAMVVGDYTMYGNTVNGDIDDGWNLVVGGNYKMEAATIYAKANVFDNMKGVGTLEKVIDKKQVKGYGLEVGAKVPALGGTVLAAIGYRDAENVKESDDSFTLITANVGYNYAFSKRTSVYGVVGYIQEDSDKANEKATGYQAGVGLIHKF